MNIIKPVMILCSEWLSRQEWLTVMATPQLKGERSKREVKENGLGTVPLTHDSPPRP